MKLITFFALLLSITCAGQEYIAPAMATSYGNHRHTNRDISFYNLSDTQNNIISIGTTERDSTFTDLLITKLNTAHAVQWQKKVSYNTNTSVDSNLSFDEPLGAYVDSNNNIVVAAHSGTNQLVSSGIFFIKKYSPAGQELWSLDLGQFYWHKVFFENDKTMVILTNPPAQPGPNQFRFLTIGANGVIESDFTRNDITDGGNSNFTGMSIGANYLNKKYYFLYRRHNVGVTPNVYENFIKIVDAAGLTTIALNSAIGTTDTTYLSQGDILVTPQNKYVVSFQIYNINRFRTVQVTPQGTADWSYTSAPEYDSYYMTQYLDMEDDVHLIYSRRPVATDDDPVYSATTLTSSGTVQQDMEDASIKLLDVKRYPDGAILAYAKNGFFCMNSDNLVINDFALTTDYTVNDYHRLNNNLITVAATRKQKMYAASSYYTNLNIYQWKLSKETGSLVTIPYIFSGLGTSRMNGTRLLIDRDNNYILGTEEKLGEGPVIGPQPPVNRRILKYDSNLNLLWERTVSYDVVTPYGSLTNDHMIADANGNIYAVGGNGSEAKLIKLSSNGILLYDMPASFNQKIFIDKTGNINLTIVNSINSSYNDYNTVVTTYDANTGTVISTATYPGMLIETYSSPAGDAYLYLYDSRNYPTSPPPSYKIFKNGDLESTTVLTAGEAYTYHDKDINGNLYILNSLGYWQQRTIKIGPGNVQLLSPFTNEQLIYVTCSGSGKVFLTSYLTGQIKVLNSDLSVYASVVSPQMMINDNTGMSMNAFNDMLFIKTSYSGNMRVFDSNGNYLNAFKFPTALIKNLTTLDAEGYVVATGQFGNSIYLHNEFRWDRIFLHKYSFTAQSLGLSPLAGGEADEATVVVYPNPGKDIVYLSGKNTVIQKALLYDYAGRLLLESNENKINIASLPAAVYYLTIHTTDGKRFTRKCIKE